MHSNARNMIPSYAFTSELFDGLYLRLGLFFQQVLAVDIDPDELQSKSGTDQLSKETPSCLYRVASSFSKPLLGLRRLKDKLASCPVSM